VGTGEYRFERRGAFQKGGGDWVCALLMRERKRNKRLNGKKKRRGEEKGPNRKRGSHIFHTLCVRGKGNYTFD